MRLWAAIAAVLILLAPAAMAQETTEPALTRVLVLGDALGGGLGAGLTRAAEATGRYEVSIRLNEESGLARPEVYDWAETVPKILGSKTYDVIVVMLGANDTQPIRQGGERIPMGTAEWADAYGALIDRLLDELRPSGARILWVGPPPMREAEYDTAVRDVAEIQRQRAKSQGVTFIDLRPPLSGPDGAFAESGPDDTGTVTRLRGRDGVSFYKAGNNLMAQIVLAAIESDGGVMAQTEADSAAALVPLFGQVLMNGEVYSVQPEGVTANVVMLTAAGLDSAAALNALRDLAPRGSAAERLLRQGDAAAAPAGRADDFAAPPAP